MSQQHDDKPDTTAAGDGNGAPAEELPQNPLATLRLGRPPFWMIAMFLVLVVVSWIPLVVAARRRVSLSESPPLHLVQDMDNQPKYKAQHHSVVFADGRADRPPVPGTVARGKLAADDHYDRGYATSLAGDGKIQVSFFKGFPKQVKVDQALLDRGQQVFNVYCTPCHGMGGYGDGPVNQRAIDLRDPKWVQAASLHDANVKARPEGHLYNTINVGIRNMAGYGSQIQVPDRWAVVAYVRALQLSQDAPPDAVPAEKRASLK